MVEGCERDETFDVHRAIAGGKYEIGNMYAICPQHHALHTRKIIRLDPVDDHTLREVYLGEWQVLGRLRTEGVRLDEGPRSKRGRA
jgi:hypothetical protein